MKKSTVNGLMLAGMVISWAIYYAASKQTVSATGSAFVAGFLLRSAAFVFLTAQMAASHKIGILFRQGKTALILMTIGVFGFLLDTFANIGYQYGDLSVGTALLKTDVLMVNIATVILYKKKLYVSDWIGTFTMLVGVLFVMGMSFTQISISWYDLFFIASAVCVTVNAFIIKAAQEKFHADTDVIAYYNNFVVLILFLVSTLLTMGGIPDFSGMGGSFWAIVILGGAAQTLIYYFYYRNLKRHEVWIVKLYLLFMPVLSCVIGVVFLDEQLSASKIGGIAIVLAGAAVILLRDKINGLSAKTEHNAISK